MLVLTRKLGEKIVIGDDIVISVENVDRGHVRLGIEVPPEVLVYREEIPHDKRLQSIASLLQP
jgi:carbon storage regulator